MSLEQLIGELKNRGHQIYLVGTTLYIDSLPLELLANAVPRIVTSVPDVV